MPKAQQSSLELKPKYLFQANIENKLTYFLISYSYEKIWVNQQSSTEWEEIKASCSDAARDGEATYLLSENKYRFTKLYTPGVNQRDFINLPYIEGKTSSGHYTNEDLDKVLLSKQKLDELGITKQLGLDLTDIVRVTTPQQEKAHNDRLAALKEKERTQYTEQNIDDWFDKLLSKGEKLIQARDRERSPRSQLVSASIFCAPSTAASSSESEQKPSEKLTDEVGKLTL